ncbi:hypothetical protein B0T14DRAFT_510288 [Immersiella caudata]|uniref:dolichol kinase n=1 Tax=Immersiella caudata TaxID=314043 RepID=A0AA40C633_9PEZI|nr:hypothetical protein B0T14DRAFT_510288 [Immersiella caudata]
MSEHLQPPGASPHPQASDAEDDREQLRILTRSPHPYHRQSSELLEPSDRLVYNGNTLVPVAAVSTGRDGSRTPSYLLRAPSFTKDSTPASESGTEADDEHFLKGLPAPKQRLHKGLRGKNEPLSGSSTPFLSPAILEEEGRMLSLSSSQERDKRNVLEKSKRRKELIRRGAEILLLACQGGLIASNRDAKPFIWLYQRELIAFSYIAALLTLVYPLRLVLWAHLWWGKPLKCVPVRIPVAFDPAPLLYPSLVPIFVSLLVAQGVPSVVPLNVTLSLSALPRALIPGARESDLFSSIHWMLACVPCFLSGSSTTSASERRDLSQEVLVLLYPLHQTLCLVLHYLTTTSLLTAELQLLSIGLINILLVGISPQVTILNGVLWGGGLSLLVLCSQVIQWGISLARVPKWRFRRTPIQPQSLGSRMLRYVWPLRRSRSDIKSEYRETCSEADNSTDGCPEGLGGPLSPTTSIQGQRYFDGISDGEGVPGSPTSIGEVRFSLETTSPISPRRHTLPVAGKPSSRSRTTPSGRRKRSASYSVRAFFSLTQSQAATRRWFYAGYVYLCIIATIFVGIREYVQRYALSGLEPVGWALGYLFGGIPWFRLEVVKANVENWICLPDRFDDATQTCSAGFVQHLRIVTFGEANTRLILSAYWVAIIIVGLAVVFSLSPIFEVDTRRKVFHFMMVAMFLPTIFVDPAYIALALSLMLTIFLLLDLLRASQLPPLSKPIATFLTPYVDGRDLRGPVVISHIFLLIGCAIPLWLSLAALPRTGDGYLTGWEIPTRDVSMVSGVVCVGLGDAAASLIGRRWGHRKWLWGGGKSIEGSIAFAVAVFAGLMVANVWLRIGGWLMTVPEPSVLRDNQEYYQGIKSLVFLLRSWIWDSTSVQKTALCASVASLTEAVLTGGNDNVVVPVVLWTCVKSMGL